MRVSMLIDGVHIFLSSNLSARCKRLGQRKYQTCTGMAKLMIWSPNYNPRQSGTPQPQSCRRLPAVETNRVFSVEGADENLNALVEKRRTNRRFVSLRPCVPTSKITITLQMTLRRKFSFNIMATNLPRKTFALFGAREKKAGQWNCNKSIGLGRLTVL